MRPATNAAPGTFEADNPAQRWQARFAATGVAIAPVACVPPGDSNEPTQDDWTFGLRLAAYGAGDALTPVSPVAPRAEGARVEYRYGESHEGAPTLTEWYVNEARGLEHGFTLAEAPAGRRAGDPRTGRFRWPAARPRAGRAAVELRAPDGAVRLRYADLFVTDASGRTLPSTLSVPSDAPARIHLSVDARDAVYPVTIDPMLTTPSTTLTGEAADNYFGGSVATAGDVNGDGYADVVVGAYGATRLHRAGLRLSRGSRVASQPPPRRR